MGKHPEDCAIQVAYEADAFRFDRLPSRGAFHKEIVLQDSGGDLTVALPKGSKGQRFSISFVLPRHYSSGGLSGIKIWPERGEKPAEYQDKTGAIPGTPFRLRVHRDPHTGKIKKLSLGDHVVTSRHFLYNVGIVTDEDGLIESHDPRIYNTGPVGAEEP